jgi:insertion element IS1 protein InsB
LAYVFGRRKDEVFLKLKALLKPFGVKRFYTDHWGAYKRHLDPEEHMPGKHHTQNIERKHLTLRTRIKRLVRKTICFSKSQQIHDIIIGLFVNQYAFGRVVSKWPSPHLEHYLKKLKGGDMESIDVHDLPEDEAEIVAAFVEFLNLLLTSSLRAPLPAGLSGPKGR